MEQNRETIGQSAQKHFEGGFYCAESVVVSVTGAYGIESDLFPKAATAFCSGMARTCGTCGALTGAMMGLSAVLGRNRPDESVDRVYDATQQLIRRFEEAFGSRNCHEILGCDLGTPEGQAIFKKEQLREGCIKIAGRAAEMAGEILSEKKEDGK